MYPSQWFAALGMLWFPWIYSTATLLLQVWPVRGITQAAVHGWYIGHFQVVLLGLLGLGAVFYFIPVFRQQALHSRELAAFTLGGLILCGGWVGVSHTVPLPSWMGALGKVATLFVLLAVWTAFMNIRQTKGSGSASIESRYFTLGLYALLAWAVVLVLQRATPLGARLDFTVAHQGSFALLVPGFSAVIGLGAAYHILPRICGQPLPWPGFVKAHFWLAAVAVALMAVAFIAGGFPQGARLLDAQVAFTDVVRACLMPIRMATMGELIWILGSVLFAVNVLRLTMLMVLSGVQGMVRDATGAPALTEGRA
jgi:cytochrome c oxidase cbb3-type subunit 1